MQSKLNPYISFKGNAKDAMEFYESVFGGNLEMTTFEEAGMTDNQSVPQQIMHASLITDNGITIMGADTPDGMPYTSGTNISISLSGDNEIELTEFYKKLSEGGKVVEPLNEAPWGDTFGMVIDKFDTYWMVNIVGKKPDVL